MKSYKIEFEVKVSKEGDLYQVEVSSDKVRSLMPARSMDEALQVALSQSSGIAQFLLSQKF